MSTTGQASFSGTQNNLGLNFTGIYLKVVDSCSGQGTGRRKSGAIRSHTQIVCEHFAPTRNAAPGTARQTEARQRIFVIDSNEKASIID